MLPSFIQISPVAGGIIAGVLHVILGPDHLCTIVTLSACQGAEAFWFGVRWAGGHLAGMTIIGLLLVTLNAHDLNLEAYEHYAYYCVGFLLMFMGGYFILYADKYFDAEWSPKQATCGCHAKATGQDEPITSNYDGPDYGCGDQEARYGEKMHTGKPIVGLRETGSVLIGFAQGIACPGGVVGMVFLKQYSLMEMLVFMAIFVTVTTIAMGVLAMSYGVLTRRFISSKVLGRSIYYISCGLSLFLGAAWVILNATHRLDALLGHDHHHGHEHGHDHVHDHGHQHGHVHLMQEGHLPNLFLNSH